MSGGHFNYNQYKIGMIADEIENLIENNQIKDQWGYSNNFSEKTIKEFREAIFLLRSAQIYAQRIDWLVSGDDGEDNFHDRLKEDLHEFHVSMKKDLFLLGGNDESSTEAS